MTDHRDGDEESVCPDRDPRQGGIVRPTGIDPETRRRAEADAQRRLRALLAVNRF